MDYVLRGKLVSVNRKSGSYNKEYYTLIKEITEIKGNDDLDENQQKVKFTSDYLKIKISSKQYSNLEDVLKDTDNTGEIIFGVKGSDFVSIYNKSTPTNFNYFNLLEVIEN